MVDLAPTKQKSAPFLLQAPLLDLLMSLAETEFVTKRRKQSSSLNLNIFQERLVESGCDLSSLLEEPTDGLQKLGYRLSEFLFMHFQCR